MTYLDFAATAPLRPEARRAMLEVLEAPAGNPSSLHAPGRRLRIFLAQARERCAEVLGAREEEVVFTSGATEANNLAVLGTARLYPRGARLLLSRVEHPSVGGLASVLEQEGYRVELLPVDDQGRVDPAEVARRLEGTVLVSMMAVNNEVGTLQPVEEVAALCRQAGVAFHCDAVQAVHLLPLPADLLTLSSHKVGGPPGAGLLYVRRGRPLAPLLRGGAQENGRRAGTENVAAVAGMAAALQAAPGDVEPLRRRLEEGLARVPGAHLVGGKTARAPHISAWIFEGLAAEPILVGLDLQGIAASSGSACSSHSLEPSHVLLAMGYGEQEARGLVRFSLGWCSTPADVDRVLEVLPDLVAGLRRRREALRP
jgi:cysteine desulfurase